MIQLLISNIKNKDRENEEKKTKETLSSKLSNITNNILNIIAESYLNLFLKIQKRYENLEDVGLRLYKPSNKTNNTKEILYIHTAMISIIFSIFLGIVIFISLLFLRVIFDVIANLIKSLLSAI